MHKACSKSRVGNLQLLPKSSVRMNILQITCVAIVGAVLLPVAVHGEEHHLRFYLREIDAGPNMTAVAVVNCTGPPLPPGSYGCFGDMRVMDDELTAELNGTRVVGRAQGLHVMASRQETVLSMSFTLLITDYPPYTNGSMVVVVGRNEAQGLVRELPVVGGTGSFRMATGYVLFKTKGLSSDSHEAALQIDVFLRT